MIVLFKITTGADLPSGSIYSRVAKFTTLIVERDAVPWACHTVIDWVEAQLHFAFLRVYSSPIQAPYIQIHYHLFPLPHSSLLVPPRLKPHIRPDEVIIHLTAREEGILIQRRSLQCRVEERRKRRVELEERGRADAVPALAERAGPAVDPLPRVLGRCGQVVGVELDPGFCL